MLRRATNQLIFNIAIVSGAGLSLMALSGQGIGNQDSQEPIPADATVGSDGLAFNQRGINWAEFVLRDELAEAISLTEEQKEQLWMRISLVQRMERNRNRELWGVGEGGVGPGRHPSEEELERNRRASRADWRQFERTLEDVLLDHQIEAVPPIVVNRMMATTSLQWIFERPFAQIAEIPEDEVKSLMHRVREIERELQDKIHQARYDALQDLLSELKPEYRQRLNRTLFLQIDPQ